MTRILYNAIKTPDGTILHSKHVHDFISYRDSNGEIYMIDGGSYYFRTSINVIPAINLSIEDDGNHENRREYLFWGNNYDKDKNLLPKTEWIKIKDLTTEHIDNILKNVPSIEPLYKETFEQELIYRK